MTNKKCVVLLVAWGVFLVSESKADNLIRQCAFSPNGRYLANLDGFNIDIWDASSWRLLRTFSSNPTVEIDNFGFSSDSKRVRYVIGNAKIETRSINSGELISEHLSTANRIVRFMSFDRLAVYNPGPKLRLEYLEDIGTGTRWSIPLSRPYGLFEPIVWRGNHVIIFDEPEDLKSRVLTWTISRSRVEPTPMYQISDIIPGVSDDGKRVATTDGERVTIWDLVIKRTIDVIQGRSLGLREGRFRIDSLALNKDGHQLAIAFHNHSGPAYQGDDVTVQVISLNDNKILAVKRMTWPADRLLSLSFSPTKSSIVMGRLNDPVLWNWADAQVLELKGSSSPINPFGQ